MYVAEPRMQHFLVHCGLEVGVGVDGIGGGSGCWWRSRLDVGLNVSQGVARLARRLQRGFSTGGPYSIGHAPSV